VKTNQEASLFMQFSPVSSYYLCLGPRCLP